MIIVVGVFVFRVPLHGSLRFAVREHAGLPGGRDRCRLIHFLAGPDPAAGHPRGVCLHGARHHPVGFASPIENMPDWLQMRQPWPTRFGTSWSSSRVVPEGSARGGGAAKLVAADGDCRRDPHGLYLALSSPNRVTRCLSVSLPNWEDRQAEAVRGDGRIWGKSPRAREFLNSCSRGGSITPFGPVVLDSPKAAILRRKR